MATYNLRRFSHAAGLKAIAPEHLIKLLTPYIEFLTGRGITLSNTQNSDELDYGKLSKALVNPAEDTPKSLIDALYLIHEMATEEGMDTLLDAVFVKKLDIEVAPNPAPADVAVLVYLADQELVEHKHAEQYLTRPRSFEYFQSEVTHLTPTKPTVPRRERLEQDLDDTFKTKKRGRGSRVFAHPKDDGTWFLVRHGEPYKREGSLEHEQSASVFYRPEKYDVVVYDPGICELRINASSTWEKDLYRRAFGQYLFDNPEIFSGAGKYTLNPLRHDGIACLVCADIDGLESVILKEVRFYWGGAYSEVEIRKADDIFAVLTSTGREFPTQARLIRASFRVKFTDSKTPRTVTIRPSNIAQYTRDSDGALIEEWLIKRGFVMRG